jgi:AcrR family transcriptional regulator
MNLPEVAEIKRNLPRQERARRTVSYFYEATAQLLERSEADGLTTKHVAERAGFSIGTLYRYFSGKQALFKAMAVEEIDRREAEIIAALGATHADRVEDIVRIAIRPALNPFEGRKAVRRALLKAGLNIPGMGLRYEAMMDRVSDKLVDTVCLKAKDCAHRPSEEAQYIVLRAVIGAIRSDVLFGSGQAGRPEFEDALVTMAASIFRG